MGTDATLLRHDGWDPADRDEVLTRINLELEKAGAQLSWLTGGEETSYVLLALAVPMGATLEQGWSDVVRLLSKERGMKVRVITPADVALAQRVWNDELD